MENTLIFKLKLLFIYLNKSLFFKECNLIKYIELCVRQEEDFEKTKELSNSFKLIFF